MSKLSPAVELGVYLQGELGVYGRPADEYIPDRDNVFKAFIDKGRHVTNYFNRFETVEDLILLMHKYRRFLPVVLLHGGDRVYAHLTDRKLEFMIDTFRFLATGERNTSLEQWSVLIDDRNRYMSPIERCDQIAKLKELHNFLESRITLDTNYDSFATYISMWCEKADGVRDMAYSLYFYSMIPMAEL